MTPHLANEALHLASNGSLLSSAPAAPQAYGMFYAFPHALARRLSECRYANEFHRAALGATAEPFFRKEDDPMNGHWLHICLNATGERVRPLPSMGPRLAGNMACISTSGLYRRPHNKSIIVHFLKSPSAMDYVARVLRRLRSGAGLLPMDKQCCTLKVWPNSPSARALSPAVCDGL